jgi:hypothetical protein
MNRRGFDQRALSPNAYKKAFVRDVSLQRIRLWAAMVFFKDRRGFAFREAAVLYQVACLPYGNLLLECACRAGFRVPLIGRCREFRFRNATPQRERSFRPRGVRVNEETHATASRFTRCVLLCPCRSPRGFLWRSLPIAHRRVVRGPRSSRNRRDVPRRQSQSLGP